MSSSKGKDILAAMDIKRKSVGGFKQPQPLPVMPNLDNPKAGQILSLILSSVKKKKK